MGLIEMLLGKKKPEFTERIWFTTELKIADLVSQIRAGQGHSDNSVVVTHFQATQRLLLAALANGGVGCRVITNPTEFPSIVPDRLSQQKITLVLASDTISSFVTRAVSPQPKNKALAPVSVHLAEHYPGIDRDQWVLALDKLWPMRLNFTCYTGLDEPWLALLGIDRIREMLLKLGVDQESLLEPARYGRAIQTLGPAIRSAQKRLAQQVPHAQACESCAEWVQTNLPGPNGP